MTQKLTEWFVNGEKPVHIGVYNVSCDKVDQSGEWFSWWNGRSFGPFTLWPERAVEIRDDYKVRGRSCHAGTNLLRRGSWRGLAEQPA